MAMNRIQFQKGLSLRGFLANFGSEAQCRRVLMLARWPQGYRCGHCGNATCYEIRSGTRVLLQCRQCRAQTSLIAGTLMQGTKLPLTTWFLAMYLLSQAKTGHSALALKRELGVSYPTAWLLHHKIMQAMREREQVHRLDGTVQLDDAYLGGERSGGKPGRGSENKVAFVAAVSIDGQGHPRYLKLARLAGFTTEAIAQWARAALQPGTQVVSDGLGCFAGVSAAGCLHQPHVVGARLPRELPQFTWVNTVLGNLKMTLSGAFHAFKFAKYADSYLAEFAYRFNRRFDLRGLLARLMIDVTACSPRPLRLIRGNAADSC
jgi:ISXO2-like transposase domain/Transposase zinc-ribbon domain